MKGCNESVQNDTLRIDGAICLTESVVPSPQFSYLEEVAAAQLALDNSLPGFAALAALTDDLEDFRARGARIRAAAENYPWTDNEKQSSVSAGGSEESDT